MTRRIAPALALSLASLLLLGAAPATRPADESKEPPLNFVLRIGDRQVSFAEGETPKLEGVFTNPQVTLEVQPHRLFSAQGVSFKYPRQFTFESDLEDAGEKGWTLSGNDVRIMYTAFAANVTAKELADDMLENYKDKAKIRPSQLQLGGHTLSGFRIDVTLVGHVFTQEVYALPWPRRGARLFVLQDRFDDNGARSPEGAATIELLKASLVITP